MPVYGRAAYLAAECRRLAEVNNDRTLGRLVSVPSCPLTVTMSLFTQLVDHLPDDLQNKARTLVHSTIDRVPEGIKRTEDTIDGS